MLLLKIRWVGFIVCFMVFQSIGFSNNYSNIEPWISTNDLFKIKIGMTTAEVFGQLGDPLFVEKIMDEDDEITTTKFIYSFRTKTSDPESNKQNPASKSAESTWGRTTNIQFIFINDNLIGWEEDKLTLSMAKEHKPKSIRGFLQLIGLILNLIIIIKIF
jgi:hypothetical protein